jgi:TolA-binding protein
MKKVVVTAFVTLLCLNTFTALAEDKKALMARVETMSSEQKEARFKELELRVAEIKGMDKSSLSRAERSQLKKELKGMNTEAKALEGKGLYLSIGAIIIIILLLILLL